jgi:hypothetical protein
MRPLDLDSNSARKAAEQLQVNLGRYDIPSDLHDGQGLALLSICVGLIVWCDGTRFWWRTGWNEEHRRFVYAWQSSLEPDIAARRVSRLYVQVRREGPAIPTGADRGSI